MIHILALPLKVVLSRFGLLFIVPAVILIGVTAYGLNSYKDYTFKQELAAFSAEIASLKDNLTTTQKEYDELKNQDQVKLNQELLAEIKNINTTYQKSVSLYEALLDLKPVDKSTAKMDELLAKTLSQLAEKKYSEASNTLTELEKTIKEEQGKRASSFKVPENVTQSNSAPGSGYSRQQVNVDGQNYLVDIIAADLGSNKVIVDTASESNCSDNCPVLSLADYASRSGAWAGVNGSYFCPASYPSCAGKTNSFDTLLMNKNKYYFNSDNNVYSSVPAVIFSGSSARFVTQSSQWGRDTSVDSVIANHPLLLLGGNVMVSGGDEKQSGKGSRSFVGAKGNLAYIGVVHNASVVEVAKVLKTLGLQEALNLDSGGSTALWHGGYKVGPGRNIPNALLFVRR